MSDRQPVEPDLGNASGGKNLVNVLQPIRAIAQRLESMPLQQQQQVMYWVGGLSPLATNVVTPMVTSYRLNLADLSPEEKRMNIIQEVARQTVSAGLQLASFFGGAWLFRQASGKANQTLPEFLTGVFFAFVSYAFIRPLVSTEIVLRYLYPNHPPLPPRDGATFGRGFSSAAMALEQQRFSAYLAKVSPG